MAPLAADPYANLDPLFTARLKALVEASGGRIILRGGSYGHRSLADQERIWADAVAKYGEQGARKWAAVPGKSNHGKGIAYDLGYANDEAREWAHQNAARFGLWFPMDHEPWHIEVLKSANDLDPDAYTTPPMGKPEVGDVHDPAFQVVRMLAAMDDDMMSAFAGPGDPMAGNMADITSTLMGAGGGQLVIDEGAATQDFGFDDEPADLAEQMEAMLDGND